MTKEPQRSMSRIDWAGARERIERLGLLISGDLARTPEQVRHVLEERARALSKPIATKESNDALELLTFLVSGSHYATESKYVLAVQRLEHLTVVPSAEPPLVGMTAWRGDLLTLFDIRAVTGTAVSALSDLGWIVVLGDETAAFGILVDQVTGISVRAASGIKPLSEGLAGTREYVRGVTSEAVLVLDAAKLIQIHT